jgi:hypothetical protein
MSTYMLIPNIYMLILDSRGAECRVHAGMHELFFHWATPITSLDITTAGKAIGLSNYRAFSAVPVPTAVWLFGSGLAGLIGAARRKSKAEI